jgi:GH15 family glucan-1,4-alpha-glucosidase
MRQIVGDVPLGGSPFPPIAEYAFLSDCEVTALVAPSGSVEWLCLPRMDGPSVFGSMLDRDAGHFKLSPSATTVPAGRRYLPGTMVLETTWGTPTGWVVVRDVLLVGHWHHDAERSRTQRRAPTDYEADRVLLRSIRCVNGSVEMVLDCDPRPGYGTRRCAWEYVEDGYHKARATADGESPALTLTSDLRLGFEGGSARARTTMHDGDVAYVALSWGEQAGPESYDGAYERLVGTADYWHEWLSRGVFPDHPWRQYLQRSALTLKGLSYAPTGAMIAAATTSLPETPHGARNWDYRYSWIRDSTFMLWGLYTLGFDWEANDFFYFIADVAGGEDEMQVMYVIVG